MPYRPIIGVKVYDKDEDGLALSATYNTGTAPTDAGIFAKGCKLVALDTGVVYHNSGTSASPSWQNVDEITTGEIADGAVTLPKLSNASGHRIIVASTNGVTGVSVFGASGAGEGVTINGVWLVALDTVAGNITVENPASTVVCTIAKGTDAGVTVNATTLADAVVASDSNVIVKSSSTGNARVFISYKKT
jgi:hypothetical protein